MDSKCYFSFFLLAAFVVGGNGEDLFKPNNYDISRNQKLGFGLKDIADFFLGNGYGNYYPGGQYPNQYPGGNYPGLYPGGGEYGYPGSQYPNRPPGRPGDHPGCPLCDSSVYSYCSHKQAHDSCCCDNPQYLPYGCRKADCKFLYANSCDEYNLISECCCIDVQRSAVPVPVGPVPVPVGPVPVPVGPVPVPVGPDGPHPGPIPVPVLG